MSTFPSAKTTRAWTPWTSSADTSSFSSLLLPLPERGAALFYSTGIGKFLPPLFIGAPQGGLSCPFGAIHLQVARWIRAKPGAAGSEGSCPHCCAMWAFLLFALQIAGLPPALRATPLINAGGKIFTHKQKNRDPKSGPDGDVLTCAGASGANPCRRRSARR